MSEEKWGRKTSLKKKGSGRECTKKGGGKFCWTPGKKRNGEVKENFQSNA